MKRAAQSFVIISLLIITFYRGTFVFAVNCGYPAEPLTEDRAEYFAAAIDLSLVTEEPRKSTIDCFDVNENGLIALGTAAPRGEALIYIYDGDKFLYGYTVKTPGSVYVKWDGDNLGIYFVRSEIIAVVTPHGEIVELMQITDSNDASEFVRWYLQPTTRTVEDTTYMIKNDMGLLNIAATSYSQVVAVGPDGETTVLYDVNSTQLAGTILYITVFIGAFVVAFIKILYPLLKRGNPAAKTGDDSPP